MHDKICTVQETFRNILNNYIYRRNHFFSCMFSFLIGIYVQTLSSYIHWKISNIQNNFRCVKWYILNGRYEIFSSHWQLKWNLLFYLFMWMTEFCGDNWYILSGHRKLLFFLRKVIGNFVSDYFENYYSIRFILYKLTFLFGLWNFEKTNK